ncbi:glycosyl hydrolase, partial [Chryseobacterium sp. HMWF001]
YSIDFLDDTFGIAVGGDYTKQEANINNIATTNDGGETWQIQASGQNAGYTTCVKIKPNSKGKEIISVGDQHISYSSDFGKTWKKISVEKGFFVCEWINQDTVVFAGNGKISVMKLKF